MAMRAFTVAFLLSTALLFAQPVQLQVVVRSPAPGALYQWAHDPTIVTLTLRNTTASLYDGAVISFAIRRLPGGAIVARSNDFHPAQPRFTLAPFGTLVLTGPQVVHESAVIIDQSLRQQAEATGQLPEGDYEFCARVLDAQGRELSTSGVLCPRFSVIMPDPPMLISPRNDSVLAEGTLPIFLWAPVAGSAVPVTYTLRVVPIFPGQSPQDALTYNAVVLNKSGLVAPTYQYTPTDIPFRSFPTAIGFVWQVAALDPQGRPAARNNGRSEIFRFSFSSFRGDTTSPREQQESGQAGTLVRRIALPGGFTLVLAQAIECQQPRCSLSGMGKIFIPLLDDSVGVVVSGVSVSRADTSGTARLIDGTLSIPLDTYTPFGLLALHLQQLRITPTAALVDGAWVARWSRWGWSCRVADSVVFRDQPFSVTGLPARELAIPSGWSCSGEALLVGSCLDVRFDTLSARVEVDTALRRQRAELSASGLATIACLQLAGTPVQGRFRATLDRGPEALIVALPLPPLALDVVGMPMLQLAADSLLLDLSSQANPPAFPPVSVCSVQTWTEPRWRGIFAPKATLQLRIEDDTLSVTATAILEQDGTRERLLVSCAGELAAGTMLHVGGFRIQVDSAASFRLCHGVLQSFHAHGRVLLPPQLQRPPQWRALDRLSLWLHGYDAGSQWRWAGTLECGTGIELPIGQLALVTLLDGSLETITPAHGQRQGYLEFSDVRLSTPAVNPVNSAHFSGLRIWNTGEVALSNGEQWQNLPSVARLSVGALTIEAEEVGFGYSSRHTSPGKHWWIGISGSIELDASSGLPGGSGGIRARRLQLWDDNLVTSQPSTINTSIGGALRLQGSLAWGTRQLGTTPVHGLMGSVFGTLECIGGLQVPLDFMLAGAEGRAPFWFAAGSGFIPGGAPVVPGAMHLLGGRFAAGWHVRLDTQQVELFEAPPQPLLPTLDSEGESTLLGTVLTADPSLQFYRYTPRLQLALNRSSMLELEGELRILPAVSAAAGRAYAQYVSTSGQPTISLAGPAALSFPGIGTLSTGLRATFGSGSAPCWTLGPLHGQWSISLATPETPSSSTLHAMTWLTTNAAVHFYPSQAVLQVQGRWEGAVLLGGQVNVGSISLPHHMGLEADTNWTLAYLYRYWSEGQTYHAQIRTVALLDRTANGDYSGYPYPYDSFVPASEHVRESASDGSVALWQHSPECGGTHCRLLPVELHFHSIAQTNAQAGNASIGSGANRIEFPASPSQTETTTGQWATGHASDITLTAAGGALAQQAQQLFAAAITQWSNSAAQDNLRQQRPPALVVSSFPAQGDTSVPLTMPLRLQLGAPYATLPAGCDSSTQCWMVSHLSLWLEELSSSGDIARSLPLSVTQTPGSALVVAWVAEQGSRHALLPGTRYRLRVEGEFLSTHSRVYQASDTIEFRTTSVLLGLSLHAYRNNSLLPRLLPQLLDTLRLVQEEPLYPLEFGRDLWIELETEERRWLWTGSQPSGVARSVRVGNFLQGQGIEIVLDTAVLAASSMPRQHLTIRVINAAKAGNTALRPLPAQLLVEMLPEHVARFDCELAPELEVKICTGATLTTPLELPLRIGQGADTYAPVPLEFRIDNTGSTLVSAGTDLALRLAAYVEFADSTRHLVVSQEHYSLRQLAPGMSASVHTTLLLPQGSRLLGIRAELMPSPPFVEQDGTENNIILRGKLPPLGGSR